MLLKTTDTPPEPVKCEGRLERIDRSADGGPVGYILTGWSNGNVDAHILPPPVQIVMDGALRRLGGIEALQKRLGRLLVRDPERKSKKEVADFLDKINAKTRQTRERR